MSPTSNIDVFWGEMSPCDHSVQIYQDDSVLLDALEGYVVGGLRDGDAAIVIATQSHLESLSNRLAARGVDVEAASSQDQYIALDAEQTVAEFMRDGWPDDGLFRECVHRIFKRARAHDRHVRAFGEMVALLWAQGHNGATVRMEHLWHALCQEQGFSLFCAYPKSGFTQDAKESIREICATHSRVLGPVH